MPPKPKDYFGDLQTIDAAKPQQTGPDGRTGDESRQFDSEVQRSLFHRASDQVRKEVQPLTWQAFWEVAVSGREVSDVAARLELTAGAVRVAKCGVIARLREAVDKLKAST